MIGDHHQLPPVIKNPAFQKYSNMEQSLFTRLIKSGVSTIDLDKQVISKLINYDFNHGKCPFLGSCAVIFMFTVSMEVQVFG